MYYDNGPFSYDIETNSLTIKYNLDKQQYLKRLEKFKTLVEKIFNDNVVDLSDEFSTAKELFLYVSNNVKYINNHRLEVYDALTKNEGYCQTYSGMYQYLLWQAGMEVYLTGSSYHMWNIVKIDGEYYHMDTTWDNGDLYNFGMNDEKCFGESGHGKADILDDALLDSNYKIMPCTSKRFNGYDFS
jgi:transglutaminase/protease-like cytokinesis protein 3